MVVRPCDEVGLRGPGQDCFGIGSGWLAGERDRQAKIDLEAAGGEDGYGRVRDRWDLGRG